MKKILAILCAVLMLASLAAAASAEEAPQTTKITTTVPSTYVLTIPATVEIPYGEKNATIGSVKVTGRITNSYRPEDIFASAVDGSAPIFRGRDFSAKEVNGNGGSCLVVARISDYAWEHAAAGTYSDTITFTASLETANAAG